MCVSAADPPGPRSDAEFHVAIFSARESTTDTIGSFSSFSADSHTKVRCMKVHGLDGVQYLADVARRGLKYEGLHFSIHSWFQACVAFRRLSGECSIVDDMNCCPQLLTPYCAKRVLGKGCEPWTYWVSWGSLWESGLFGEHLKCDLAERPYVGCVWVRGRRAIASGVGISEPSKLGRHELRSPFHGRRYP